jgi:nudix-type nucleoside diphosphatase (YffH/AdpP family)
MDFFFFGTLCHAPLLRVVIGRDVAMEPAHLPDYRVAHAGGHSFPVIVPEAGARAPGMLVRDLSDADILRIDFYTAGFAQTVRDMVVEAGVPAKAGVFFALDPGLRPGVDWRFADWQAAWGDVVTAAAVDVMALYGQADPRAIGARYGAMLVRGASTVRAAAGGPVTLRRATATGDVAVAARATPYAHFFAVEEYDLSYRRFDGALSPVVNRAVFISGDAVTVLPYDSVRDRVLLIEQFRVGPYARGDAQPWLLEAIAGRIDPGETPEAAARREAVEEAGLELHDLRFVGGYYPSPGAKAEYLYSYVALTDLPDGITGVFGVAGEAEDIRGHLVGFDRLIDLVATGEINNAPLLLTVLWLARARAGLRAG